MFYSLLVALMCAQLARCGTVKQKLAPYDIGTPNRHVENHYFIHLETGYSLESHFEFIGMNLANGANNSFEHFGFVNAYGVKIESQIIHEVIRKDPRVAYVEHNHFGEIPTVDDSEMIIKKPTIASRLLNYFRRDVPTWSRTILLADWNIAHLAMWGKRPVDDDHRTEDVALLEFAGSGVNIYIMDSGVRIDHSFFQEYNHFGYGKAVDFKNRIATPYCGAGREGMYDYSGHGTHVAAIAKENAMGATIVNVKLQCQNQPDFVQDGMIAALRDILAEHNDYQNGINTPRGWKGSVINMSFNAGNSLILQLTIDEVIRAGIVVVTSSGNGGKKDGATGPCGLPKVQCVGASTRGYASPEYSNWGPGIVQLMAPGDRILSADFRDQYGWRYMSGTSQSSPHVAGTAAIFIGFEGINNNVDLVNTRLMQNAQPGLFSNVRPPWKEGLMVNHGMMHPDRDARLPYVGPPYPNDNLATFSGNNNPLPRPSMGPISNPEDRDNENIVPDPEFGINQDPVVGQSDPVPT